MNLKHQLYQKRLATHLVEGGIDEEEAQTAATMAMRTLKQQGAGFQMGHARKMAEWMLKQKAKVDAETLVQESDGGVFDKETNTFYTGK